MKPGITTITKSQYGLSTVEVGNDERAIHVSFGTLLITLSNIDDINTIMVRASAHDYHGKSIPVEMSANTVLNQVAFTVKMD